MKFSHSAKVCVVLTSIINTLLVLIFSSASYFTPSLHSMSLRFSTVLMILLFSFLISAASLVLYVKRIGMFFRLLIHFALLCALLFIFVALIGNFAGESPSRSAVLFISFLVFAVVYAAIALLVCAVKKTFSKNKTKETATEYESQF